MTKRKLVAFLILSNLITMRAQAVEVYLQPDEPAPFAGVLLDEDRFREAVADKKLVQIGSYPKDQGMSKLLIFTLGLVLGASAYHNLAAK